MSERDARAQKRRRVRRLQQTLSSAKKSKKQKEQKQEDKESNQLDKLNSCLLSEAADGVLCQVFAFLNVRDHWKLSRTSSRMEKVSHLLQASPPTITIPKITIKTSAIVERLMNFRPLQLRIQSALDTKIKWEKIAEMTSLRELSFDSINEYSSSTPNMQLLSKLTRLVKLKMPANSYNSFIPFPSSLTHFSLTQVTNSIGFGTFDSAPLFLSGHLAALEVLELPTHAYYGIQILKIGQVFPALRELSFGFLNVRLAQVVDFSELKSCENLESLSLGVDSNESICQWETLSMVSSLRKLTIALYVDNSLSPLFNGLAQVEQLTYLKLVPHQCPFGINISDPLRELVAPTALRVLPTTDVTAFGAVASAILPRLKTLLISTEFEYEKTETSCASLLSIFSSLTELELPNDARDYPDISCLPHLRKLHVSDIAVLNYYRDQVSEVVYKKLQSYENVDYKMLATLKRVKHLTSLKILHQNSLSMKETDPRRVSSYFKRGLPATIEVEEVDVNYSI